MTNRRGGLSCTASPSIPAGTDLRALTSRSGAARGWPREGRTVARHVENDNPELAGVERGAGAAGRRAVQRVRVVGHEHDGELRCSRPASSTRRSGGACPLGPSTLLRSPAGCASLRRGSPAGGPRRRRGTVGRSLRHVDPALDPAGERLDRTGRIVPVHPHIDGEVVACPRLDAHERKVMHSGCCGHHRERPVTASHPPAHRRRSSRRPGSARGPRAVRLCGQAAR